jgi:hypothetical protein
MYHKLSTVNVAKSKTKQQAFVMYYDSLIMDAHKKHITKAYMGIVTKTGLKSSQKMLGVGINLGMKKKSSKKFPLVTAQRMVF